MEINVGSIPLPWSIRMKIALGAAKGLAFLHEEAERPVIYRDFKTSNILLDAVSVKNYNKIAFPPFYQSNIVPIQEYNAKLSDFGLAKDGPEGDKTHVSTRVMGTYGYAHRWVGVCPWIFCRSTSQVVPLRNCTHHFLM